METAVRGENQSMRYLLAFAIIFVILGHTAGSGAGLFTVCGLFPFYSFHVPVFLFVSGYFYRESSEKQIGRYLLKKCKTLLIPFYAVSLVFLLLQTLMRSWGFSIGGTFTFYDWLIRPWIRLQPRTFSIPSWYLIAFFICCILHLLVRKLASCILKNALVKELSILIFYLLLGMAAVFVKNRFDAGEAATVYLRSAAMMFFLQLGYFYRKYLEKRDTAGHLPYLAVVVILRFLLTLVLVAASIPLEYGLFGLKDFPLLGIPFYLSGILGIAFWLRICKIIAEYGKPVNLLISIGKDTKYIMLLHLFGMFLLNLCFYACDSVLHTTLIDKEAFFSQIYYASTELRPMILLYLAAGLAFSMLIAGLIRYISGKIKKAHASA